jgi:hypothetical protein
VQQLIQKHRAHHNGAWVNFSVPPSQVPDWINMWLHPYYSFSLIFLLSCQHCPSCQLSSSDH